MKSHAAFTLTELMVIMAIIAVLVGLLMPTISRARDRALLVSCQSNLRQIGIALHGYMSMNRNKLPPEANIPWPDQTSTPDPQTHLPTLLAEFAGKATDVYACPADDTAAAALGGSYIFLSPPARTSFGGHYYGNLFNRSSTTTWVAEIPLTVAAYIDKAGTTQLLNIAPFHRRALTNILYADGHVESTQ